MLSVMEILPWEKGCCGLVGRSAVEEAIYLAGLVEKVTVIHRRDELRAQKSYKSVLLLMIRLNLFGIQLLSHLKKRMGN